MRKMSEISHDRDAAINIQNVFSVLMKTSRAKAGLLQVLITMQATNLMESSLLAIVYLTGRNISPNDLERNVRKESYIYIIPKLNCYEYHKTEIQDQHASVTLECLYVGLP